VTTNIDLSKLVDLAVSATSTPNPLLTNSPFTVAIKVGNSAPVAAEGVFVTNQVTAGLQIVSVTTSQGSYSVVGQVIVFNLGSLAGGSSANFTIQEVTTVAGPVTNNVFVTSSSPELVKANNSVVLAGYATQPPAITGMFYSLGGVPDGKVYYSAGDGSPDQFVTNGEEPRLSPDGQYLAFKRGNANYSQASLYLRNLKTGEEKLLYQDNDFLVGYGWTADSSQVFFDYSCAIYAIGVGGANVHPLVSRDCYDDVPAVFAGTGNFVFHNIHSGLWLAGLMGTTCI
jgi:uncharacterized repeat protein (TIGR01451 family)